MVDAIWRQRVQRDEDTCTVVLGGELDLNCVTELTSLFLAEAERRDIRVIQVDLADVGFIDSCAIGALINGYKNAQANDTTFTITGGHGHVRKVLDVAGVLTLLDSPRTDVANGEGHRRDAMPPEGSGRCPENLVLWT